MTAPSKDTLPTALNGIAPSFNWTATSTAACTSGSSATTGIIPGGRCSTIITFKPTIAGQYSVPLLAVSNVDVSKWPMSTATFEVKSVVLDLIASPFECNAVYPNVVGTCTTVLTNYTPAGVSNTYPVPSVTFTGSANGVMVKNANNTAKTTTNCPATGIAPGASCKLSVTFNSPSSGTFPGTAVISSNGQTDSVDIVPVVTMPDISLSPFICPSAAVGDTSECTATFKNSMTTSVLVSTLTQSGSTGFGLPTMAVKTVPAGQSSVVKLPFKFTTAGDFSSVVTINTTYGAVSAPAAVKAADYPAAAGSLSPFVCPTINWGSTGSCTATLSNNSTQRSLAISSITKTANTAFGALSNNCGTTLQAGGSCVLTIPVLAVKGGTYSTDVTVKTNPVLVQTATVVINEAVVSAISPPVVKTSVNTAITQTSTFKNESAFSIPLQATNFSLSGVGFTVVSNSCTGQLAAGASGNVAA